ncbi:hypothetical protein MRX96_055204 [Rhipicephalus microplus]
MHTPDTTAAIADAWPNSPSDPPPSSVPLCRGRFQGTLLASFGAVRTSTLVHSGGFKVATAAVQSDGLEREQSRPPPPELGSQSAYPPPMRDPKANSQTSEVAALRSARLLQKGEDSSSIRWYHSRGGGSSSGRSVDTHARTCLASCFARYLAAHCEERRTRNGVPGCWPRNTQ